MASRGVDTAGRIGEEVKGEVHYAIRRPPRAHCTRRRATLTYAQHLVRLLLSTNTHLQQFMFAASQIARDRLRGHIGRRGARGAQLRRARRAGGEWVRLRPVTQQCRPQRHH